jgi:Ca-activated chloride channel family protein
VTVTPPGESARAPFPRERIADGEVITVNDEGLAWLRRDAGATLLVHGPAKLTVRVDTIQIDEGRVFIDTPPGVTAALSTPNGPLELAHVRASIDVSPQRAATDVYVLAGEVKCVGAAGDPAAKGEAAATSLPTARAGEKLTITGKAGAAKAIAAPALTWEDWTGGLATTDRAAQPAPFGIGTVGARKPGSQGAPHAPLAIQKLDVRVTINQDLAITEVDEVFFNPTSETVEGIYRFRTPEGAALHRFGVDREGTIVWGRVKEKQAAAAQYQSNVYEGSTEDPALLEWDAPGVYRARLYPIRPGEARRVVVRYAEWLGRTGPKGERRLYIYPMAAEGADASLPHIEELTIAVNLAKSGAKDVRTGMAGVRDGDAIIVREHDIIPRADLALELFDEGLAAPRAYTAPHAVDLDTLPPSERSGARDRAKTEADYVLIPLRPDDMPLAKGGLDLAIVVDTSAATDPASLAIARAATAALLAHAGKSDRAIVWAGDATLRPIVPGQDKLAPVNAAAREAVLTRLAAMERGGATDLGAMLSQAAAALDPDKERRSAIVYIGDGQPTVGELQLADLRERMAKLPRPVRVFSLGVGEGADMAILSGLARGSFAERIGDANAAARAALRLLEFAERPAWLSASVDLGAAVERVFPRDLGAVVADESLIIIGRLTGSGPPTSVTFTGPSGPSKKELTAVAIDDQGDLSRRWADARLTQMIDESIGRAAMVDLGVRHGIITPVTSLYVPTTREMSVEERAEWETRKRERRAEAKPKRRASSDDDGDGDFSVEQTAEPSSDRKDGATGTRAKGEEGSLGRPSFSRSRDEAPAAAAAAAPPPQVPAASAVAAAEKPMEAPKLAAPGPMKGATGGEVATRSPGAAPSFQLNAPTQPSTVLEQASSNMPSVGAKPSPTATAGKARNGDDFGVVGLGDQAQTDGQLGGDLGYFDGRMQGQPAGGSAAPGYGQGSAAPRPDAATVIPFGGGQDKAVALANQAKSKAASPSDLANEQNTRETTGGWAQRRSSPSSGTSITITIGDVPHAAKKCGAAANLPFEERIGLWRERLGQAAGSAWAVAGVYRTALALCEAPTWRERSKLLSLLLDATPTVAKRVELWRVMFSDLGAADALYRGILARVRTPQEARELHAALGLQSLDPGVLAKLLKDAKTPAERATKLRALVAQWPNDFTLALRLLDALEDAGDDAGARELGRRLRARPDADARLRTAVGELYLRLAKRAPTPEQKAQDELEAKRAFGEIVEFAPDDPVARRRLGDLLRAHGWFDEAARQYETLARLAPDDSSIALLLAAAAEGRGKLEEAVRWTEKGGAAGAPDAEQSPARTARAFAAAYLAWGRLAAKQAGKKDEEEGLKARYDRVVSADRGGSKPTGNARVILTWAHPELHPTLWSNALGAPMPAPEGDVTLGVAQAMLPSRPDAYVEIRLEADELAHAARLGAEATLTVVLGEGGDAEAIVKLPVTWSTEAAQGGRATRKFAVSGGEVREVMP